MSAEQRPKENDYDLELENAILNLVVSLCKQKEARGMGPQVARKEAVEYLTRLATGLESME